MDRYKRYLNSSDWKEKKAQARKAKMKGGALLCYCCGCGQGGKSKLECHHLSYKNLGNERMNEMEFVCSGCHREIHEVKTRDGLDIVSATQVVRLKNKGRGAARRMANKKKREAAAEQKRLEHAPFWRL